jgi:hypothetical protein
VTTAVRWYLDEYRGLILTLVLAVLVLWAAYLIIGPSSPERLAKAHTKLVAECRGKYAASQTLADSARADVWPDLVPFEGRKNLERNDLFNCGALGRRGELK